MHIYNRLNFFIKIMLLHYNINYWPLLARTSKYFISSLYIFNKILQIFFILQIHIYMNILMHDNHKLCDCILVKTFSMYF